MEFLIKENCCWNEWQRTYHHHRHCHHFIIVSVLVNDRAIIINIIVGAVVVIIIGIHRIGRFSVGDSFLLVTVEEMSCGNTG